MLADDPEAPTTINRRFNYPVFTGGSVTGSVVIDPGSVAEHRSDACRRPRRQRRRPARAGLELPGHGSLALGHRATRSP